MKAALDKEGASVKIVAPHLGTIKAIDGSEIKVDQSFLIAASVLFDAVYIPGGKNAGFLNSNAEAIEFINEAYKHCKVIGADEFEILGKTNVVDKSDKNEEEGIIINSKTTIKISQKHLQMPWEITVSGTGKQNFR